MDFHTLGASVAANVLARVACYPLDTIAIQHASSTRRPIFSVPLRSYYRGIGASISITTPAVALYYCTYRAAKASLMPYVGDSTYNYIASGVTAELASSLLWTPLEVVKARLQISRTGRDGRLLYQLRDIAKKEGIRGFYRGYLMGLGIYIPYNAISWAVYENMKKLPADLSYATQVALSAGTATICVHGLIYPFDLVKTRYQVATSETVAEVAGVTGRSSDKHGIKQILRNVMRESGKKGFYAGFFPRLMCSFPSTVITMSVIEFVKPDTPVVV
ncbi:mitochondrial carrier domain-containing protein [Calycina marina]|uniref:Mitochondrial carrier domain-containing protein n=1 Tax=Calycina marina TaxID=1763456 RepID=A0A9P7Z9H6_9HELO|nr:mitochondrial carrier domain-containing protein [Calycina marina]